MILKARDPQEARRILDEECLRYGTGKTSDNGYYHTDVPTHRLPAYGLLLAAPQEPERHRLPMQWPDKGKHVPEMAFDKVMVRSMLGCLKKPTFGAR